MSNQDDHPHVPLDPNFLSTPARRRYRPSSPIAKDHGPDPHFSFTTSRPVSFLDIDVRNGVRQYPQPNMDLAGASAANIAEMTMEQKVLHLTQLAEAQQRQMQEANEYARRQDEQLRQSQDTVQQLTGFYCPALRGTEINHRGFYHVENTIFLRFHESWAKK